MSSEGTASSLPKVDCFRDGKKRENRSVSSVEQEAYSLMNDWMSCEGQVLKTCNIGQFIGGMYIHFV